MSPEVVDDNLARALEAYDALAEHEGRVVERPDRAGETPARPHWIDLPAEAADVSAPDVHGALTSVQVRTGLWRTLRPVIDLERCRRCYWVCSTQCPDGVIRVAEDGTPEIDYEHCKGCLVCMSVCPTHAISAVAEVDARRDEEAKP
jgi:pyruvate ferredoxin oxidoreductase gamma subunit